MHTKESIVYVGEGVFSLEKLFILLRG